MTDTTAIRRATGKAAMTQALREMSDEELDRAIDAARARAHEPDKHPFNEYNEHADGTKEIRNPSRGWAKDSAEWVRLCEERDRRLALHQQPPPVTADERVIEAVARKLAGQYQVDDGFGEASRTRAEDSEMWRNFKDAAKVAIATVSALERRSLSDFSDAEIATEHHHRAMMALGDQRVGVSLPVIAEQRGGE